MAILALWVVGCGLPQSAQAATTATPAKSPRTPTASSMATTKQNSPVGTYANYERGFALNPTSPDDYGTSNGRVALTQIRALGANAVTFTANYVMDSSTSSTIHAGRYTPTDAALAQANALAKLVGMHTTLALYVDPADGTWRARAAPKDRDMWFSQYGAILNHLADVAQKDGFDRLTIGVELISLSTYTSNPDNTERWRKLIADVRARFHGKVMYAANWGGSNGFGEEYRHIGFWDALDVVGIDAYYPLTGHTGASVATLVQSWGKIHDNDLVPFSRQVNRQIIFTEVGYRSIATAAITPSNSKDNAAYDDCAQARAYDALLESWKNSTLLLGISWWDWNISPNVGGKNDTSFSPRNKPAEAAIAAFWGGTVPAAEKTRFQQCIK